MITDIALDLTREVSRGPSSVTETLQQMVGLGDATTGLPATSSSTALPERRGRACGALYRKGDRPTRVHSGHAEGSQCLLN